MKVYTYSKARQHFASVLDEARREGEVIIRRRDGQEFVLKPLSAPESPLDVPGLDIGWTKEEIVSVIREGRERDAETES